MFPYNDQTGKTFIAPLRMYLGGNRRWVPRHLVHLRPRLPVVAIWSVTEVKK